MDILSKEPGYDWKTQGLERRVGIKFEGPFLVKNL